MSKPNKPTPITEAAAKPKAGKKPKAPKGPKTGTR